MARARGKPAADKTNFSDLEQARRWLGGQSREVRVIIAARAALRALPLIARAGDRPALRSSLALPVYRAAFVSWVVAEYPAQFDLLREAAVAANAAVVVAVNAISTSDEARNAANAANAAAYAARHVENADAATNAVNAAAEAVAAAANEIRGDALELEKGRGAASLAVARLWPQQVPELVAIAWSNLQTFLLAGDDWDVWVRWYQDRLEGRPSLGEAFDLAIATLPDELWKQGPGAVNARIKELIAEYTPGEPIPGQGPGPHFALGTDLKIALALPTEIDAEGNNLGRIRQLLPQVRQAAGDLAGHVSQNSQPEISRNLAQYREAIAGEPETIAWGTVFGLGVRLENAATAAQREIANRLQEPLEDAAQEALDSVLTLHGPLILATAEGRELSDQADQFRLTREEQAALRDAARQVAEALKNSNLADAPAARLTEEAAETIGEGTHPERGAAFGLATIKNVATLAIPAAVLGTVHGAIGYWIGGDAGIGFGAAAAAFFGFGAAEVGQIRIAARSLGTDFLNLIDTVRDQADLAQAQIVARVRFLAPFRDFVTANERPLRQIAEKTSQLRWALRYIDFITRTNSP